MDAGVGLRPDGLTAWLRPHALTARQDCSTPVSRFMSLLSPCQVPGSGPARSPPPPLWALPPAPPPQPPTYTLWVQTGLFNSFPIFFFFLFFSSFFFTVKPRGTNQPIKTVPAPSLGSPPKPGWGGELW